MNDGGKKLSAKDSLLWADSSVTQACAPEDTLSAKEEMVKSSHEAQSHGASTVVGEWTQGEQDLYLLCAATALSFLIFIYLRKVNWAHKQMLFY